MSTLKPPHNKVTILVPTKGNALKRFVITVAPQNDIWPQGSTYLIKAVAIISKRIITPKIHTKLLGSIYDP